MFMKKLVLVFLLVFVLLRVFAIDYNEAISKARELSTKLQDYASSYEYQDRMLKAQNLKDRLAFGVDVSEITIAEENNLYPTVKFDFTLPEYVDDLKIKASVKTNHNKSASEESYKLDPSLSVSKSFTFKDYEDTQEDLSKEKNRNTLDSGHEKQLLSYENSFIDSLISIMELKASIRNQETNLSKMETNFDANIKIGNIDSGSLAEVSAKKNLDKTRIQLQDTKNSLKTALEAFENEYGFPYEDITTVPQADLSFTQNALKSVTVRNAELNLQLAKQKLDEKTGNKTTLNVSIDASPSIKFDQDGKYVDTSISTGAKATFGFKNLSVSASYDGTITEDDYNPSLTISGRWNNESKPKEVTDLEVLELQNAYISAKNSYDDAVFVYETQSKALVKEIETLKTDFAMQDIDDSYDMAVLSYKQEMFNKGLITQTELDEAKTEVELDAAERIRLELRAVKLQNKIIINNL